MLKNLKNRIMVASISMISVVSGSAHAALTAEESAVYTSVTTLISDHSTAALALLTAIIGAFIGFKLLKKFVSKAT